MFLLLYVNDKLIAAKSMREIDEMKSKSGKEFEMKDQGSKRKILGTKNISEKENERLT